MFIAIATKPVQQALKGAKAREQETGRPVPEDLLGDLHKRVSASLDRMRSLRVPVEVWDTGSGSRP